MTENSFESTRHLVNEITRDDPIAIAVLKGHLLIEEQLNELIRLRCKLPASLDETRFSAIDKIRLCRALWGDPQDPVLWRSVELLNTLRSELAHSAGRDKFDSKLRKFVGSIEADIADTKDMKELHTSLVNCLACLHQDLVYLPTFFATTSEH